ncbi:hypothetical protein KJ708_09690, partial [bacterium]|nr:hypothetical protein [bacterium]
EPLKNSFKSFYLFVYQKFKIDAFYDAFIIYPIKFISNNILNNIIDKKVIDGLLVNGSAYTARFVARTLAIMQTGHVGHYVLYIMLGLCFVLYIIVMT